MEWLSLIQECRLSGLTDKQWCEAHQICPSNFYYQIKKFRNKACEIPKSQSKTTLTAQKQDFVKNRSWVIHKTVFVRMTKLFLNSPSTTVRRNYYNNTDVWKSKYLLCRTEFHCLVRQWNLKLHFRKIIQISETSWIIRHKMIISN